MRRALIAAGLLALAGVASVAGPAEACGHDGCRSIRVHGYGPVYHRGYFSGVIVRVAEDGPYRYRKHRRHGHARSSARY